MKKLRLSVDDGCASDVRIAELADKYDLECIFYLPVEWHSLAYEKGYEPLHYDDALKIADKHKIGSHTITHRHLTQIPQHEAEYEIKHSKDMLEELLDTEIEDFAPPRGYSSPELDEFTKRFYEKIRKTKGQDDDGHILVHIHENSGANNNKPWEQVAIEVLANGDKLHCWGHSWEIERQRLWQQLEEFLEHYA